MSPWKSALLHLYYYGTLPHRALSHVRARARRLMPITIFYYHRIADDRATPWTTSNLAFRQQILWLKKRFRLIGLDEVQRRIRQGENTEPCIAITFDDGYADNCERAIPFLIKQQVPCTYFVTLGNVLSGKPFDHDVRLGTPSPANTVEQVRWMSSAGIDIGAHTHDHPDLGKMHDQQQLFREIHTTREELGELVGKPIGYFAFPIGQYENLSTLAFDVAFQAGYEGVCSAYGGHNLPGGDPFHLQRVSSDEELIRIKNRAGFDPRKQHVRRFAYPRTNRPEDRGDRIATDREEPRLHDVAASD